MFFHFRFPNHGSPMGTSFFFSRILENNYNWSYQTVPPHLWFVNNFPPLPPPSCGLSRCPAFLPPPPGFSDRDSSPLPGLWRLLVLRSMFPLLFPPPFPGSHCPPSFQPKLSFSPTLPFLSVEWSGECFPFCIFQCFFYSDSPPPWINFCFDTPPFFVFLGHPPSFFCVTGLFAIIFFPLFCPNPFFLFPSSCTVPMLPFPPFFFFQRPPSSGSPFSSYSPIPPQQIFFFPGALPMRNPKTLLPQCVVMYRLSCFLPPIRKTLNFDGVSFFFF